MRICLVSQEYLPEGGRGGIGSQTYLKAHGLSARGHDVHVVSSPEDDGDASTYLDRAVTVHRVTLPEFGEGLEQSTTWLAYSAGVACKLAELVEALRFDVIQFPEYGGEGFVWLTDTFRYRLQRYGARYVVQLHGPLAMFAEHMNWPAPDDPLYRVGRFMERESVHRADLVLASSHNTARFTADAYEYPVERVEVIHSGVDTDRFRPEPPPHEHRGPNVLFVGNVVSAKGVTTLLRAVTRVRVRHPGIRLRIIGIGEPRFEARLLRIADRFGAGGCVELLGYVDQDRLPEHYAWADIFAGPSAYEPGPGNVYLEAMAAARPVIACDTGGAPEVVLDGETGVLVPPYDTHALGAAIERLAADGAWGAELGRRGREHVEREFALERYLDKVERAYERLMGAEAVEA
jgi:glycosyltransferase involved in cell wall biosynthesis